MPQKQTSDSVLLIIAVMAAVAFAVWFITPRDYGPLNGGLAVGEKAPPIQAAGWINGEPPTEAELNGRVVVVEAWASW